MLDIIRASKITITVKSKESTFLIFLSDSKFERAFARYIFRALCIYYFVNFLRWLIFQTRNYRSCWIIMKWDKIFEASVKGIDATHCLTSKARVKVLKLFICTAKSRTNANKRLFYPLKVNCATQLVIITLFPVQRPHGNSELLTYTVPQIHLPALKKKKIFFVAIVLKKVSQTLPT